MHSNLCAGVFRSVLFCSVLFCSVLFCYVLLRSVAFTDEEARMDACTQEGFQEGIINLLQSARARVHCYATPALVKN
jgi:hypothetical protein